MRNVMFSVGGNALTVFLLSFFFSLAEASGSRTLEFPFALSSDARSEFGASFQVFSAGRIVIEGVWNAGAYPLHIALVRPDGSEAARREGHSALRLEYAIAEAEADKFNSDSPARWSVKIINSAATNRQEVSGKLRLTIPTAERALE